MDVLTRIKQLVIARRVEFTMKAELERLRDGLSIEDVLESVVNAHAVEEDPSLAIVAAISPTRAVVCDRKPELFRHLDLHEGNDPAEGRAGGFLCLRLLEAR